MRIVEWQGDNEAIYVLYLPCNADGKLPLEAVHAGFGSDVMALKFEVAGGWELLMPEHGLFSPPYGGFATKTFVTVKAKGKYPLRSYPTIKVE